ncbi:MAG: lamin tail domain-containing protein, partial [Chloroflexota bacterium]|nr:lamin tail domain-containing protein [Chloroflexota bacterium]
MKRAMWLAGVCLLGGLMVVAVVSGLRMSARAAGLADSSADALDVVISEVAWMGTAASAYDEWIELYNPTDQSVDLTGWTLTSSDGTPTINLTGTIHAHGYYLLERTDNDTVSDIPADQTYTGDMLLGGEVLTLTDDLSNVIDTANFENGGAWPAGSNNPDYTMERIDPTAPDTDANWHTNDGVTRNGLDADGNPINGTPKAQNSCYQPPTDDVADLVIVKTGPVTVDTGDLITYYITISNTGATTATGTFITDTLPAAVGFVTQASPFAFTQLGGTLIWQAGEVPTGTQHSITVT